MDLDYTSNQSKIIIEGNITNEAGPYLVKITKSINLTDTSACPTIDDVIAIISDDAGNSELMVRRAINCIQIGDNYRY